MRIAALALLISILFLQNPESRWQQIQVGKTQDVSDGRQEVYDLIKKLSPSEENGTIYTPPADIYKRIYQRLLSICKESSEAKAIVVNALVEIVEDKNAFSDSRIYATDLLCKMRVIEALDIIARNLDLKGSFSSLSLNSRPMVNAIVQMGEMAIPHLENALYDDRISIREEASVALGFIGGEKAKGVLEKVLATETNEDVVGYIKGAISEINIKARQKQK